MYSMQYSIHDLEEVLDGNEIQTRIHRDMRYFHDNRSLKVWKWLTCKICMETGDTSKEIKWQAQTRDKATETLW